MRAPFSPFWAETETCVFRSGPAPARLKAVRIVEDPARSEARLVQR